MLQEMAEASPRRMARIAGFFYLLNFVTGAFSVYVSGNAVGKGDAANLVASLFYLVVTALFYGIFRPVNKSLSLLAALFSLLGCAATVLIIAHRMPVHISPLVFFGFYCLLIGYLVTQSTFLPRTLGVFMAIGGLGWLTFLSPPLAHSLYPYNLAPGIIGEGLLTLWLVAFGVNPERWRQQARAAGS